MNQPIVRLFALVVLMFALLLAFTSRWTVFEASSLRENPLNARMLLEQQRIDRGAILAADGTVLARSVSRPEGIYQRTYPTGEEFANAIGYYYNTGLGSTGLEQFRSSQLNGKAGSNLQSILDQLQGQEPRRDPVKVMPPSPSFTPTSLRSESAYKRIANDPTGKPLVNRATQFGYAPGSTFKVVTATAAIDTGAFTPSSTVSGRNDIPISGVKLQNDHEESFPQITLTQALVHSVNTVWAQVAVRLGKGTLARYMNRFGFDRSEED